MDVRYCTPFLLLKRYVCTVHVELLLNECTYFEEITCVIRWNIYEKERVKIRKILIQIWEARRKTRI